MRMAATDCTVTSRVSGTMHRCIRHVRRQTARTTGALNDRVQPRSESRSQDLQSNLKQNKNLKATRLHALWAKQDEATNLGPDQ